MNRGTDSGDATPSGCLDVAALDALATQTDGVPDRSITMHLESCARCRSMLDEMRNANRFLEQFRSGAASEEDALPLEAGTVQIPGYETQGLIGFGGQGAVFRAIQSGTNRIVAIKVPMQNAFRRPATRYRFQREIELTARLGHPGIVRVIGPCDLADGRIGCIMEFIEGDPFHVWAEARRREGRGSTRRIVRAGARVADAIAYAHQRAVLHRDIKPSNVIVTDGDLPRVLDFGLAKALDDSAESFATQTGAFVGTLSYAAPEQIGPGVDAIDMRTDVYGLGLLLYQALTGRLPHAPEASAEEVLRQIREVTPPRPSSLVPGVGDDLDAILLMALAKDQDRRYASAAEFRDDLQAWLQGDAVRARFDSRFYLFRKTLARRRKPIAAAAAITAALLGGTGVSIYNILSAADAERREQYETRRAAAEVSRADAVQQVIDELLPINGSGPQPARKNLDRLDAKLEAGLLRNRPLVESAVRALLASTYADREALAFAEYNYRQALALTRRHLGTDSPEASKLANRLAGVLLERGKLDEAQALCERALAERTASLGPNHADVAECLITLGRIRLALGDAAFADRLATRAARILEAANTATGRQQLACQTLFARIAISQGSDQDASAHAEEALRIAFTTYSDEHPAVERSIRLLASAARLSDEEHLRVSSLADALASTRTDDRPGDVWESLVDLKKRVLGHRAPELAPSYIFLGRAREREGDPQAAVDALFAALDVLRATAGEDSLAFVDCSYYLQYPLARLGRFDEFEPMLAHRYRVYEREYLGTANIAIVVAHREWAAALSNLGHDERAEVELLDTLEQIRTLCHGDPFETLRAEATLAEVLAAKGDLDRALTLARTVYEATKLRQSAEHGRAALILALGTAQEQDFERTEASLKTYERLVDLDLSGTLTGPQITNRRILGRIVDAYARADMPEPLTLSTLRRIHGLSQP